MVFILVAQKKKLQAEEKEAEEKANKAKEIRDQCDAELADVMPEYQNALKALDTLRKKDIDEIRVMTNPPQGFSDCFIPLDNCNDEFLKGFVSL